MGSHRAPVASRLKHQRLPRAVACDAPIDSAGQSAGQRQAETQGTLRAAAHDGGTHRSGQEHAATQGSPTAAACDGLARSSSQEQAENEMLTQSSRLTRQASATLEATTNMVMPIGKGARLRRTARSVLCRLNIGLELARLCRSARSEAAPNGRERCQAGSGSENHAPSEHQTVMRSHRAAGHGRR